MMFKKIFWIIVFFLGLSILFFNKTYFSGQMPFPGDILVSEYNPWRSYSYLGYVPGSYPNKAQYFDVVRQIYPWKTLSIDLIKKGKIPLWNPYNFSGHPLVANFQSAVFYPLNIVYFIFPQIIAWSILVILQPFLAALFTYFYCRQIGAEKTGAILSSVAFSGSLFMSVFVEYNTVGHVIAFFPLLLFSVERILIKPSIGNTSLFVLSLIFSFFGGHLQIFGFVFAFSLFYLLSRLISLNPKRTIMIKNLALFIFLICVSFGIFAIQLFPTLELISFSARTPQQYSFLIDNLILQFQQFMGFISPDFFGNPVTRNYLFSDSYPGNALYIGLVPFVFSIFSIFILKKNYFIRFFFISFLVLLFFLTRNPVTELIYKLNIPFFSTGSPTNAIFLLSFCLSVMSGFGIEHYVAENKRRIYFILSVFIVLFIAVWLMIITLNIPASSKNFAYSTFLFVIFFVFIVLSGIFKKKLIFTYIFIAITVFDLFYFFQKFNPFVTKEFVFPNNEIFSFLKINAGVNRVWGYGSAAVESNFHSQYQLFSPDGYDPLYPKIYGEFIQSSKSGKINTDFNNQTRSDAVLAGGFGEQDLSSNKNRLKVLDVIGVKYVLDKIDNGSTEKTFPGERFKLIFDKNGWKVFENKKALPRAFVFSSYKVYKDENDFENIFFNENHNLFKTILLEEDITGFNKDFDTDKNGKYGKAKIVSYDPDEVIIDVETNFPGLLFLSDVYYPSWRVFVDGKETKIYKANYAFRANVIPEGNHRVVYKYDPEVFYLGMKVSIISLSLFVCFLVIYKKRYER